jgi:hypothetical protein
MRSKEMKTSKQAKNSDLIREKRLKNIQSHTFKPGQSGNPKGHPKGQRNFITIYREALKSLATRNNMTELELENEILEKGILNARRGEYRFYKDIQDRIHGMANQSIDLTTGGKELPAPIIRVTRK